MVTKWIQFTVAPENAAAFDEQLARLAAASKTEAGCAHYAAFRSTDPENVFTVLESWDSAESFEAHRVAAHTAEFKKRCGAMILEKSAQSLLGICFWREAPEAVVGPDRRAGKRGMRGEKGVFGV